MNILSFILGVCAVLVVGGLTVGVVAFFKVIKLKKYVQAVEINFQHQINEANKNRESNIGSLYQSIDTKSNEIYRTIDSRFDKLDNKIKEKNN
jgi:uncharacterized protein HemX